ncbi:MAG: DMT family transporter [bacterium]|nr:DMT family transporter [bacterium]
MFLWFILALGSALSNSATQVIQKWAVSAGRLSKISITFLASVVVFVSLFLLSGLVIGFPVIQPGFWFAVIMTGILNAITFPVMLKAYSIGEFSSVYSMILLTPVFLVATSFIFLGEAPSWMGLIGVVLTVVGLSVVTLGGHKHTQVPNFKMGNWLGVLVALVWSVSVNFDKLSAQSSDAFFAPAMSAGVLAICFAGYLLIRHRSLLVRIDKVSEPGQPEVIGGSIKPALLLVALLGLSMTLGNILHNSALLHGPASYTIAIKRVGVLFGVFWGWLFFKEKGIAKKVLGSAIAIAGVVAILFS